MGNSRTQITDEQIDKGLLDLSVMLRRRLNKHGRGTFSSRHEALGTIEEEMHELREAVSKNTNYVVAEELMDVAVGALFGSICMTEGTVDW